MAAVGAAADGETLSCPATAFVDFLAAFAEQPALQPRFTRYPLAYVTVEEGANGPAPAERRLPADSIREPLLLSAAARARQGLELRIDSAEASRRRVVVGKADTDYQIEYTFARRADGCWELVRYDNQSL